MSFFFCNFAPRITEFTLLNELSLGFSYIYGATD